MFCQKCGQPIATGIQYCPGCGADVSGQTIDAPKSEVTRADLVRPVVTATATPVAATAVSSEYAGFGHRFGAVLIDGAIGWVVSLAIQIPLGLGMGLSDFQDADNIFAMVGIFGFAFFASFAFSWLYEALLTSSAWQGTVGKKALGIIVTDENGGRISFLRATGRHFAKMLSGMLLLIGYLIQPFTPKRQALHDILAGTLVLKPGSVVSPPAPTVGGVQE